ncbi:cadherin-related family member 5 isoform X1 [Emydura macquarii macquarii]|uniref:cadherin-related family member 5 isoform X1 n=1 Tax=Emydura macquarii macquarii TaxID=1129001 RepID=UPI00352B6FBC
MAVSNQCSAVVFLLLLPLTQVLAQNNPDCSVGDANPKINENNLPGTVVTTITMEPGITVTIDTSSDSTWFDINGTELILLRSLDYENGDNALLVTLNCLREGAVVNSLNVIVSVGNLNDNSPVFNKTNITEKVPEDTKVNTTIIPSDRLTAKDNDLDTIQYELTWITPEAMDYFNIRGVNNPAIYLRKALDYEKNKFMQLILYARDRAPGNPGNTATATINIDIQQVDTKPPWFQPCTFINADKKVCISSGYSGRVNISEKTTEPLVLEPGPLYAIDPDYTLNEKIVYTIVGGNKDDVFLLNSDTGNLTMNKAANVTETFILHVMATQANNAQRYSLTTIEIKVIIKSSHPPYFTSPTYTGTVSAGLPALSLVMESGTPSKLLKIFAADDDFPTNYNPQITYNITNSSDFIVTRDGLVLTNTMLESAAIIIVSATATDEESLQKANTIITVEVTPSRGTTPLPTSTTTAVTSSAAGTGAIIPKPSGSSSVSSPEVTNMISTANSGPTESTSSGTRTTNNAGTSGTTKNSETGTNLNYGSQGYSAQEMAALGATLAVLLAISLFLLGLFVYKHYGNATKCLPEKGSSKDPFKDFSNKGYQDDENPIWSTKDSDSLRSDTSENATPVMQQQSDGFPPLEPAVESTIATASAAIKDGEEDKEGKDTDSVKEVKSILTKDRKTANDGYKAVWFRDDIDPDTKDDVVVIEDQVIEEDDSDGDGNKNEEDEQDSQHGDPVVSFILESAQRQAPDANLKPDQGAATGDAEEDILL